MYWSSDFALTDIMILYDKEQRKMKELKNFFILWSTQALSNLGSSMTSFALTLWLYEKTGSALQTALLSICSYAPYVTMSIFAGALSDRWNKKKVMLVCDTLAIFSTLVVFILLKMDQLVPAHLYVLNALNGLMNTVQQPASDVAMTLIIPKKHYQKTSGMRSFSQSLITILNPVIATTVFSFWGISAVIGIDICTFLIAFIALLLFIKIPVIERSKKEKQESMKESVKGGIEFLLEHRLVLILILFLAGVNLVASAFDSVLPAYVLSAKNGGKVILGLVTSTAGIATLIGSLIVTILGKPKDRIRTIYLTMLISLSVENFLFAFCRTPFWWCVGQIVGWVLVPVMSVNLDVILRSSIPVDMQGRVYACRNSLQFFTIPVGFFLGGFMVDKVCEPIMETVSPNNFLVTLFGSGKGSGSAMMMFILGVAGTLICLMFGQILKKYKYED